MNLEQILEDLDLLVPNSLSDEKKVSIVNQLQKQIYREFKFPKRYEEQTVSGQVLYPLPVDCKPDQIHKVVVNDTLLEFDRDNFDKLKYLWQIEDNQLKLSDEPKKPTTLEIYYNSSPNELTVDDMLVEPDFPSDHHQVLVYGCAVQTAKREQQYDIANILQQDFALAFNMAKEQLRKPRKRRTTMTRAWI
jgi:hypothetical protein